MKEKGFAQLLLVILLLIGIGVGVYLVQFTQIFKPKASEPSVAATKYGSTPLSEIDKYPKPSNHVQIAENLDFGQSSQLMPYKDYLQKELDYLWINTGVSNYLTNPVVSNLDDFNVLWSDINSLKSGGTKLKVGLYAGGISGPDSFYPNYPMLSDSNILHYPNGQPIIKGSQSGRTVKVINPFDQATLDKNAKFWKDLFIAKNVDGILYDGYTPYYIGDWLKGDLQAVNGCKEGPCHTTAFWQEHLGKVSLKVAEVSPGKDILLNGLSDQSYDPNNSYDVYLGKVGQNIANYGSGVLAEHVHMMYESEAQFKDYLEAFRNITGRGKQVFFWAEPQLWKHTNPNFTYSNDLNLERFFLGTYLLMQKNPLTWFGYHPGSPYRAYDEATGVSEKFFYKDWNLNFGNPQSPFESNYAVAPNGIYYRGYDNGVIYVNPTNRTITNGLAPQQLYRIWEPCIGTEVRDNITLPPKSGMFLFYAPRGCNSSPVPSPAPSFNMSAFSGVKNISPGNQAFIWDKKPGAVKFTLKIDDQSNAFNQQCNGNNLEGDRCETNLTANYYTFNFISGHQYTMQIFQHDASGAQLGDPIGVVVKAVSLTNASPSVTTPILESPNARPSVSPNVTPSSRLTSSPTDSYLLGDINFDGKVNIFDYNLLITDFGKKNDSVTKADLDNDDDVDIFDFNILIKNFRL